MLWEHSLITDHSIGEYCHSFVFRVREGGPGRPERWSEGDTCCPGLRGRQEQTGATLHFMLYFPQALALFCFTKPQIGAHGLSRGSGAHVFVNWRDMRMKSHLLKHFTHYLHWKEKGAKIESSNLLAWRSQASGYGGGEHRAWTQYTLLCSVTSGNVAHFRDLGFIIYSRGPQPPGYRVVLVHGLSGTRVHSRGWAVG